MLNKHLKSIILSFLFLIFTILFIKTPAYAQDSGISVLPSILELDLSHDKPQAELIYKNTTGVPVELQLTAHDFTEYGEDGILSFLSGEDAQNYQYSLSSWITYDTSDFQLNSGESKTITVFVDKNRLTPRAHYSTIQATVIGKTQAGKINLKVILSSILIVRTNTGHEIEDAKVDSLTPELNNFIFPDKFILRFQNNGNVEVTPHGLIQIFDLFGNQITTGIINEGSLIVIPASIRRFVVNTTSSPLFVFPGIYHFSYYVHYGKTDKYIRLQDSFFTVGNFNAFITEVFLVVLFITMYKFRKQIRITIKKMKHWLVFYRK